MSQTLSRLRQTLEGGEVEGIGKNVFAPVVSTVNTSFSLFDRHGMCKKVLLPT
jgi:hypothetical protein